MCAQGRASVVQCFDAIARVANRLQEKTRESHVDPRSNGSSQIPSCGLRHVSPVFHRCVTDWLDPLMFVSPFLSSGPLPFHKGSRANMAHPYFAGISNCLKSYSLLEGNWLTDVVWRNRRCPGWPLVTRVTGGLDGDTGHLCPVQAASPARGS